MASKRSELVSLKDYFEAILHEHDKRNEQRFSAQGDAINKAEEALTTRLNGLNELRGDVATKSQILSTDQRVQDIISRLDRIEGRSGGVNWTIGIGFAVGTLVAAAIGIYLKAH